MSLATHCRDLVTLECAGLHHLTGTQTLTNHHYVSSYSYTSQLLLLNIDNHNLVLRVRVCVSQMRGSRRCPSIVCSSPGWTWTSVLCSQVSNQLLSPT